MTTHTTFWYYTARAEQNTHTNSPDQAIRITVKRYFYARVLFMRIMRGHIWSDKFVSHYIILAYDSYARRHVHSLALARQTVALLTPLQSAVMALLRYFQVTGVLAYSRRNGTRRYRETVGKCRCPTRGASRAAEKA